MLAYAKQRILALAQAAHSPSAGLTIAALKVMQRVILVQSRGVSDPRVAIYFLRFTTNILGIDCIYSPSFLQCHAPVFLALPPPHAVAEQSRS